MQIDFLADNAFTRQHARLIWQQFFPFYLRSIWLRWIMLLLMFFVLGLFISFLQSDDAAAWLRGWWLPESFASWIYGPVAFLAALMALALLAALFARASQRKAESQFAAIAVPEQTSLSLSGADVVMKSPSATFCVPLAKITGLALNKQALAIGFSGTGLIIPRSAFATLAAETAFLRGLAEGMTPEALQRSSEAVRKVL